MGAYIFFRTAEKSMAAANQAAQILDKDLFNQALRSVDVQVFIVWSEEDLEWFREEPNPKRWERYFLKRLGEGDYKVSAMDERRLAKIQVDYDLFFEKSARLLNHLNKHVEMRYLSSSCAFSGDYYTDQQIALITQNGALLSGDNKAAIQARIDSI